jgi:hypothetical protein
MTNETRKLSITYSSDLIPPPKIMSTLAVFFDEIWLPYPYDLDPKGISFLNMPPFSSLFSHAAVISFLSGTAASLLGLLPYYFSRQRRYQLLMQPSQNSYMHSKSTWKSLFEQQILRILPPVDVAQIPLSELLEKVTAKLQETPSRRDDSRQIRSNDIREGALFLVLHTLYTSKISPELFVYNTSDTNTSRLAGFLVNSIFQYQIPKLQELNSEQILEVRDYLKDTKQGFTYYIHEMTDDVEQRLKGGNLSEIEAAQKTFERKILPQYEECRRQLAARKTGYWANVLSASADFLKVDATPWTPKFYGELLKWLGVALNLTAKDEEALLTNKNQAFQYLARLESKVSKTLS